MLRRSACVLGLLAMACGGWTPPPAELERMHVTCERILARGELATARPRDVGRLSRARPDGAPVVVYGADWCRACRYTAAYLEQRGIPYEERDVQDDPDARASLARVIEGAHLPPRDVLPVVVARDTVMYGFMPCLVEQVWRERATRASAAPTRLF